MKVAMICSEANPFVKTGGLADVTYSLSKELVSLGEEVAIILPFYNSIKTKGLDLEFKGTIAVNMSWRHETSNVYHLVQDGINYYFLENRNYFERDGIYGFGDDGERFAFYTLAVVETLQLVNFKPDIIHVHDWQPGMLFCYLREKNIEFFKNSKFVLSIHNPAFQGILDRYALGDLYNLSDYLFYSGQVEFGGMVSTLKAGIVYADKITTVSPNHRFELLTPEGSMGLNRVLCFREYDFTGILNGIDYVEFNPSKDKYLVKEYGPTNFISGKAANKKELVKKFGLYSTEAPLYGLVSRITWQKGMNLVFAAVRELAKAGACVVLLGSGEYDYEQEMEKLHREFPNNVGIYIGYNNELAHLVYAGSDFFMMPSLFEPCGLGQMIAQRYGTLPIVRRTGGLRDSVINYDGHNVDNSNGFGFDVYSEHDMIQTCFYAYDVYSNHHEDFKKIVKNALLTDNSWLKSVKQYHQLYLSVINK